VTSCQAGVSGDGSSTRLAHWSGSHRVPRSMSATPFICYALTLLF
jgi:hypothetical protein